MSMILTVPKAGFVTSISHISLHDLDRSADRSQPIFSYAFRNDKCLRVVDLVRSKAAVYTLHKTFFSIDQVQDVHALMAVQFREILNCKASGLYEFQFVQAGIAHFQPLYEWD